MVGQVFTRKQIMARPKYNYFTCTFFEQQPDIFFFLLVQICLMLE